MSNEREKEESKQDEKFTVSRRFVVFTDGDEDCMIQLSNTLNDLEKARSFCKAWKFKRTFIYEFVENGS